MEQLCIFDTKKSIVGTIWHLYIDGAARNNPGPAGAGVVISKDEQIIKQDGFFLGSKTNNQAEYLALLLGIFLVKPYMKVHEQLIIISDSQLLVQQLNGVYRVKDTHLRQLFTIAQQLLIGVSCQVKHVLREHNKEADAMANKGIDTKHAVPEAFLQLLSDHQFNMH